MNFCIHCGANVQTDDRYCSRCGHPSGGDTGHEHIVLRAREKEPVNKLCCELAYTGTLFWLPLVVCPNEKHARFHANQGLWLLILSVVSCTLIRALSVINGLLAGGLLGTVFSGVYSLLFTVFLFGMLFLLVSAVTRAMGIHREEGRGPILFFEKLAVIKEN